jgi:hypothetical protein
MTGMLSSGSNYGGTSSQGYLLMHAPVPGLELYRFSGYNPPPLIMPRPNHGVGNALHFHDLL